MGTKNRPGRFDAYNKAEPDEPMFVLLGRDPAAPILINLWIEIRARMGEVGEKVDEARTCAEACATWLHEHGKGEAYVEALEICEDLHELAPKIVVISPKEQPKDIVDIVENECPNCHDQAIKKIDCGEFGEPAWTADDWSSEDYAHSQEIDYCPFCGFHLGGVQ